MSSTNGTPRAATPRSIRRVPESGLNDGFSERPKSHTPRFAGAFSTRWSWPFSATRAAGRRPPAAARAASMARTSSFGRNGFCRQTTSARSGHCDTKSSVVMPDMATTARSDARSRIMVMRSQPLVPSRKISTIATSKLVPSNACNAAVAFAASTISKRWTRSTMEIIVRTSAWSSTTRMRGIGHSRISFTCSLTLKDRILAQIRADYSACQ